jgi:hypothetical protein
MYSANPHSANDKYSALDNVAIGSQPAFPSFANPVPPLNSFNGINQPEQVKKPF